MKEADDQCKEGDQSCNPWVLYLSSRFFILCGKIDKLLKSKTVNTWGKIFIESVFEVVHVDVEISH